MLAFATVTISSGIILHDDIFQQIGDIFTARGTSDSSNSDWPHLVKSCLVLR
ncbi:unnamed protein product [Rodentolepis nana]|uniref:Transposase n=1 Tax=Rodentolepis nana TaxID=102285 RepID=A0A0R3T2N3_RODNA|nr:unnamed protein product [Rodentolepis nana]